MFVAMLLMLPIGAMAQRNKGVEMTITGTVVDDAGMPVVGATVTVKGDTSRGVAVELDGSYKLSVSSDDTIVAAYIGYESVEQRGTAEPPARWGSACPPPAPVQPTL